MAMNLNPDCFAAARDRCLPLLDRLSSLFEQMDAAYDAVAGQYGFQCHGCEDNCCRTRFYHHTLIEYLYLMEGMNALDADAERETLLHARQVCEKMADADRQGKAFRVMCPLNRDERCILYPYRPMICRLHGIPHELRRADGSVVKMPGCDAFFSQCRDRGKTEYIRFDRTPLYRQMAMLEKELRLATGANGPIKLTVAQMLATRAGGTCEID
jgi:Fe-S-cluster containining protein